MPHDLAEAVRVGLLPGPTGAGATDITHITSTIKNLNNIDNRKESEFKNSWRRFRICVFFMQSGARLQLDILCPHAQAHAS